MRFFYIALSSDFSLDKNLGLTLEKTRTATIATNDTAALRPDWLD